MKFKLSAKLGAVALAGALALTGLSATAAQAAVSVTNAKPGQTITVSGSNVCKTSLVVAGKGLGKTTGGWSTTVKAPTAAGTYTVTGVCDNYGTKTNFTAGKYTVATQITAKASSTKKGYVKINVKLNLSKTVKVKIYDGKKYKKTVTVKAGKSLNTSLTKLKKGKHTIKLVYGKTSKTLKVRVK